MKRGSQVCTEGSLRPQWRVLNILPNHDGGSAKYQHQMQPFSSLEDNTVWTWTGEFRQVRRTWTKHLQTSCGSWDQQRPMGGRKALELSWSQDFCFHWLPSPCLKLWSASNPLRCCRQEHPPCASSGLGLPFDSLSGLRDIWIRTFHLLTPTIFLHVFTLLWAPCKLEPVERCFYGLRFYKPLKTTGSSLLIKINDFGHQNPRGGFESF